MECDPGGVERVVLDLMLPGRSGLDVLKPFRQRADTPILILGSRTDPPDHGRG